MPVLLLFGTRYIGIPDVPWFHTYAAYYDATWDWLQQHPVVLVPLAIMVGYGIIAAILEGIDGERRP